MAAVHSVATWVTIEPPALSIAGSSDGFLSYPERSQGQLFHLSSQLLQAFPAIGVVAKSATKGGWFKAGMATATGLVPIILLMEKVGATRDSRL